MAVAPLVIPTSHPVPGVAFPATMTTYTSCTIPTGTAVSTIIDMTTPERLGYLPLLVSTPSAWDSAKLTLQISFDGSTWLVLNSWHGNKTFTTDHNVSADMAVLFDGHPLRGVPYFRLLSGTVAAPVNQTATRLLRVICGTF